MAEESVNDGIVDAEFTDTPSNQDNKAVILADKTLETEFEKEISQKIKIIDLVGKKWKYELGKPIQLALSDVEVKKVDDELEDMGVSKGWIDPQSTVFEDQKDWDRNPGLVSQVLDRFPYLAKLSTVRLPEGKTEGHNLNDQYLIELSKLQSEAKIATGTFLKGINFSYDPNIDIPEKNILNHSRIAQLNKDSYELRVRDRELTKRFQGKQIKREVAEEFLKNFKI